jgi:hypothetical protein
MKRTPEAEIGTLQWLANEKTAQLHCFAPLACSLSIDFLDPKGRMVAQHKTSLQKGPNQVRIPLPRIKPGEYNAWVTVGELTAIRSIKVDAPSSTSERLQGWITRMF